MSRSSRHNGSGSSGNTGSRSSFLRNIREFIGETVTIFTTSGGASGFGFTGVILSVNQRFLRLMTDPGASPANPLADSTFGDPDNEGRAFGGISRNGSSYAGRGNDCRSTRATGSVCDIPIDRIAAFTHNAI